MFSHGALVSRAGRKCEENQCHLSSEDIRCVMSSHTPSASWLALKHAALKDGPVFPIRPLLSCNEYVSHKREALWAERGRGGGGEIKTDPKAERGK